MYCVLHSYLYRCGIRASLYLYSCYFTFEAYLQISQQELYIEVRPQKGSTPGTKEKLHIFNGITFI